LFKILLTDYPWPDLSIESTLIEQAGATLVVAPDDSEGTLVQWAAECDAILTCWANVTEAVLQSARRCKIVSRMGIGLDNIDLAACRERGILVTNVPDYCVQEVAEHTIASILALGRNIPGFHWATQNGIYDLSAAPAMRQIHGATLGLIGVGRIGRRVARLASAIGMNVVVAARSSVGSEFVQVPMDDLARQSDYISLHAPLTEQTQHLVDGVFLKKMKPTAFLINTSRGPLIDHLALAHALSESQIAGAALDVQDPEPPDLGVPPFNMPQVVVTPHAAFVSETSLVTLRETACRQLLQCLAGERPDNVV